jgi:MoaA/NifB/PqqE/SkfB family radical SAM enzyme
MTTPDLADVFTSRGNKFWHHPEALDGLRNGKPRPVVSHIMLTDTCQHTCAFCSVATREGNTLKPSQIIGYVEQLIPLGLKAIILSGGGNPILYRFAGDDNGAKVVWDFNSVVDYLHGRGLEIGVITNGMPMVDYDFWPKMEPGDIGAMHRRKSWKTVRPETLDKLTWVRISMSGLDHKENEVFVPDIDPSKTTLGFSYVAHDIYDLPAEPNHGKVSTEEDVATHGGFGEVHSIRTFESRIPELTEQLTAYVKNYRPTYVRLLPNCLEVPKIKGRCDQLQKIADTIDPSVVFVQYKPPEAPKNCWLGYLHPVLNSDGYVYPCDSCVLNKAAEHKFAVPWRVCRWDEIGNIYAKPARSLIRDPAKLCPGCVFTRSNHLLEEIVNGAPLQAPSDVLHPNFV